MRKYANYQQMDVVKTEVNSLKHCEPFHGQRQGIYHVLAHFKNFQVMKLSYVCWQEINIRIIQVQFL